MSYTQSEDLKKMMEVLLRAIYEVGQVKCPPTFIILNQKLHKPLSEEEKSKLLREIRDDIEGNENKEWNKEIKRLKEESADRICYKWSIMYDMSTTNQANIVILMLTSQ